MIRIVGWIHRGLAFVAAGAVVAFAMAAFSGFSSNYDICFNTAQNDPAGPCGQSARWSASELAWLAPLVFVSVLILRALVARLPIQLASSKQHIPLKIPRVGIVRIPNMKLLKARKREVDILFVRAQEAIDSQTGNIGAIAVAELANGLLDLLSGEDQQIRERYRMAIFQAATMGWVLGRLENADPKMSPRTVMPIYNLALALLPTQFPSTEDFLANYAFAYALESGYFLARANVVTPPLLEAFSAAVAQNRKELPA